MNDFFLGRYLVTAEEYCLFLNEVGNHGYLMEKSCLYDYRTIRNDDGIYKPQAYADRCPACPITWVGADAYCAWLTKKLGCPFRLPTEDEWEAAARGPEGRLWPWGNEPPIVQVSRAYSDPEREEPFPSYEIIFDAKAKAQPYYRTRGYRWNASHSYDPNRAGIEAPVGSFPMGATPEGVFDMMGFWVGQWCSDVYVKDRFSLTPVRAEDSGQRVERVIRGLPEVEIDRDSYRPRFSIWSIMPDDGARPATTAGRVWSRVGQDSNNDGAMFRVAMDASGN